jgi:hypothetical protein
MQRPKMRGIIAFAKLDVAANVTLLHTSTEAERFWLIVHSDQGPFLVGVWYRPPCPGEIHSITTLEEEWQQLRARTVGTVILGDLNVHHRRWLRHSSKESAEGAKLRDFCAVQGLKQMIKEPTRGPYLLDLILSDVSDIKCKVLPAIADHKAIVASLILMVPKSVTLQRTVWRFAGANWDGLRSALADIQWGCLAQMSPDDGADFVTNTVLEAARTHIGQRTLSERKCSHPWLTERALALVQRKHDAAGTPAEEECRNDCSKGLYEEYGLFVRAERDRLARERRGSKSWWARTRRLLQMRGSVSSIPALKNADGEWILDPAAKANLLADTFASKYALCEKESS